MTRIRTSCISFAAAFTVACILCSQAPAQQKPGEPAVKPSENKGKTGQYQVKTAKAGNNYYVYVPKSYSDDNPAGLHIYFHGQNGQGGAQYFGGWAKHFLDSQNLIGINMQFEDGDNMKDTSGKCATGKEAINQVIADYKIIVGRGVICSFSGGGLPHGEFLTKYGKQRSTYPFNHTAIYSCNFRTPCGGYQPMSWYISVGSEEWNLAGAGLGASQTQRFADLMNAGNKDVYLEAIKGKGHSISDKEVNESARLFHVSDIVLAPFVYAPDYTQKELAPIAAMANGYELGQAATTMDKVLKDPKLADDVKTAGEKLKKILDKRADDKIELMKQLAQDDPPLFSYYIGLVERQFAGHPRLSEIRQINAEAAKNDKYKAALNTFAAFAKFGPSAIAGGPKLPDTAIKSLEKMKDSAPETSLLGKMIREFAEMK